MRRFTDSSAAWFGFCLGAAALPPGASSSDLRPDSRRFAAFACNAALNESVCSIEMAAAAVASFAARSRSACSISSAESSAADGRFWRDDPLRLRLLPLPGLVSMLEVEDPRAEDAEDSDAPLKRGARFAAPPLGLFFGDAFVEPLPLGEPLSLGDPVIVGMTRGSRLAGEA